jgi:hypothetical protein
MFFAGNAHWRNTYKNIKHLKSTEDYTIFGINTLQVGYVMWRSDKIFFR